MVHLLLKMDQYPSKPCFSANQTHLQMDFFADGLFADADVVAIAACMNPVAVPDGFEVHRADYRRLISFMPRAVTAFRGNAILASSLPRIFDRKKTSQDAILTGGI